jgi:hypothetical protein
MELDVITHYSRGDLEVMNSSKCLSDEECKYKYFFAHIYLYILFSRIYSSAPHVR